MTNSMNRNSSDIILEKLLFISTYTRSARSLSVTVSRKSAAFIPENVNKIHKKYNRSKKRKRK